MRDRFINRLRYFNKYVTNPLVKIFAGRGVYAIVHHAGRRSGREYATPVLAMPVEDGFVIPLPYGENTDWCRNVIASGGCLLEWKGSKVNVVQPEIIAPELALHVFPKWLHRMLRHAEAYLKVYRSPKMVVAKGIHAVDELV